MPMLGHREKKPNPRTFTRGVLTDRQASARGPLPRAGAALDAGEGPDHPHAMLDDQNYTELSMVHPSFATYDDPIIQLNDSTHILQGYFVVVFLATGYSSPMAAI